MTNKNPLSLTITNKIFKATNFLTHEFDWQNPVYVKVSSSSYTDYQCKNCGMDLMESLVGEDGSESVYEMNTHDDELKTCNELLMEEIIE